MAKAPRRPSAMTYAGATRPAATPDPPPAATAEEPPPLALVAEAAPAATENPAATTPVGESGVAAPDDAAAEQPVARPRRRHPDKLTIYPDIALKDKLEDLALRLQRTHRKRAGGRVDKGVIHDAVLTVAFAHLDEVDRHLRDYLS